MLPNEHLPVIAALQQSPCRYRHRERETVACMWAIMTLHCFYPCKMSHHSIQKERMLSHSPMLLRVSGEHLEAVDSALSLCCPPLWPGLARPLHALKNQGTKQGPHLFKAPEKKFDIGISLQPRGGFKPSEDDFAKTLQRAHQAHHYGLNPSSSLKPKDHSLV